MQNQMSQVEFWAISLKDENLRRFKWEGLEEAKVLERKNRSWVRVEMATNCVGQVDLREPAGCEGPQRRSRWDWGQEGVKNPDFLE